MSAAELSRFDDLISRHLDGALTGVDAAELAALLAEPPLAARFLETTRLNSEIAGLLAAPVPDAAMVELVRSDIERGLASARPPSGLRLRLADRAQPLPAPPPTGSAPRTMTLRRRAVLRTLAWAALFVVFAGSAAFFLFNRTRPVQASVVASVQGEVRSMGEGRERVLTPGDSWRRDEKLKTSSPNSRAILKFHDGSQLDFGGDTVAVNESGEDGLRVRLDHGTVEASLKPQPARHPFVLATPEAEAIVVGTTLRLVTGGHRTRLEVTQGEARFRRRHDGAEIAVKAGHYAVVAPNAPLIATPFHRDPHAVH